MKLTHEYEVTVSRVNEGPHQEPYEKFTAVAVSVDAAGNLKIDTAGGGKLYGATLWDGYEVKRRTTIHQDG